MYRDQLSGCKICRMYRDQVGRAPALPDDL